jgi:hypothetical protein
MRRFLAIAVAFQCARLATAGTLPLTAKDIALMLKMGYSSESIMHDLNAKHFAGPLDPSSEAQIRQLNASPALLDALKSGNYAASEQELAQARKRIADEKAAEQKATEGEAADHTQSPADQKRADAYREYFAQQKLDERVKTVLSSSIRDKGFSRDYQRVWERARQMAGQEFPGRRESWRRPNRIQELMQDEAFVRDTLK